MGRVWKARDEVLHRDVAIKELVPPPSLTPEERREMRERSLREARAIARLNNINVVRIFDVLRTDGDPWIVMEYVPSKSLQDTLAEDGPVSSAKAIEIGLGVLGALKAAHKAGVMHRDVKPGNVLLGDDGRVVLTDFGLATIPGDPNVTRTGMVLGSPAYIAPERARDGTAGPEADLWSLGATLYAAVEGKSPYARPSAIATLAALATEPLPPPKNAGPLKPVLQGLLRKDPAERITAEVAERLLRKAGGKRAKGISLLDGVRRPGPNGPREPRPPLVPAPRPPAVRADRPAGAPAPRKPDAGTATAAAVGTALAADAAANTPIGSAAAPTAKVDPPVSTSDAEPTAKVEAPAPALDETRVDGPPPVANDTRVDAAAPAAADDTRVDAPPPGKPANPHLGDAGAGEPGTVNRPCHRRSRHAAGPQAPQPADRRADRAPTGRARGGRAAAEQGRRPERRRRPAGRRHHRRLGRAAGRCHLGAGRAGPVQRRAQRDPVGERLAGYGSASGLDVAQGSERLLGAGAARVQTELSPALRIGAGGLAGSLLRRQGPLPADRPDDAAAQGCRGGLAGSGAASSGQLLRLPAGEDRLGGLLGRGRRLGVDLQRERSADARPQPGLRDRARQGLRDPLGLPCGGLGGERAQLQDHRGWVRAGPKVIRMAFRRTGY